ncbi:MAG TPA: hypothetical protein VK358_09145, partial [Longimicrobium sp.]|nr:hypothetical protein [Longimicrobium sp.]
MSARAPETEAALARANPPGQRQLHYRVGTYGTFLQRMLDQLPRAEVRVDGAPPTRPLETLDPGSSCDFAAALLDAWATVGDVLTFYQERILNEGFLRTAREARSIRELTSQLGFPLQPGLAARTWLAFGVSAAPGARAAIEIPAGTAAQSIPATGEMPQTFETSAKLRAFPAWNALAPAPAFITRAPSLAVGAKEARLASTGTGLTVGAPVLAASGDGAAWTFGTVTAVETAPQLRETRAEWSVAAAGTRGTGAMDSPAVWAFSRTARLFGYNAAEWTSLTAEQKRAHREILGGVFVLPGTAGAEWRGVNDGLPATDVRALAVDDGGRVYAGTAGAGLFASADGGRTWAAGGPRYGDVHALAAARGGIVYAGLTGGHVYRSSDGGASWDSVSGATRVAPVRTGQGMEIVPTRLPAAPVRALFADADGTLYAGTDFGVYSAEEAIPAWTPVPLYAPGAAPASNPAHPTASPASSTAPAAHPSPAPGASADSSPARSSSTESTSPGGPSADSSSAGSSSSSSSTNPPSAHAQGADGSAAKTPPTDLVHSLSKTQHVVVPAVWCFARAPWGELVAGTDAGVWSVTYARALGHGIPAMTADGLPNVVRALFADGTALLAATDAG